MAEPFLGEIKLVGFNFAPRGWAYCDGQMLPINQNQSLYSLLGTTFGGDGRTTFALPDLRGRTPIHTGDAYSTGDDYSLGQRGGLENVTLTVDEMPVHAHGMLASSNMAMKSSVSPNQEVLADTSSGLPIYSPSGLGSLVELNENAVTYAGGSQAHNNMQPSIVVGFCIALQGLFPSRN